MRSNSNYADGIVKRSNSSCDVRSMSVVVARVRVVVVEIISALDFSRGAEASPEVWVGVVDARVYDGYDYSIALVS